MEFNTYYFIMIYFSFLRDKLFPGYTLVAFEGMPFMYSVFLFIYNN